MKNPKNIFGKKCYIEITSSITFDQTESELLYGKTRNDS